MRTRRRFQPSFDWMPTRIAPGGLQNPMDPVDVPSSPTTVPMPVPTDPVDVPAPTSVRPMTTTTLH